MRSNTRFPDADEDGFLSVLRDLAASLAWQLRSFEREEELIALVALDHDPSYEQVLWVYDRSRGFVRCLLVRRGSVPPEREADIIELCAHINDGLAFGCAEYSFDDRTLVFRDSFQLSHCKLQDTLVDITSRLLNLGSRYSPAVRATLAGKSAAEAIKHISESPRDARPNPPDRGETV